MTNLNDNNPAGPEEGPAVHEWIQRLRAGATSIKLVPREVQLQITEILTSDGYSLADVAALMGVSTKTVQRLRKQLRTDNALRASPGFADEVAGDLVRLAETEVQRIRRTMRDKEISPEARISGSVACFGIYRGLVDSLQKLGRLPSAATEVRGELVHLVQHDMTAPAALLREWERINGIVRSGSSQDPESLAKLEALGREVRALGIVEQIQAIPLPPEADKKEDTHG